MQYLSAAVIVVLALAAPAHAGDTAGKAKFRRASAHFSLGKFKQAAKEYEELYVEHPEQHVLLYNIAQAHRLGGEPEKALFCYRRYLSNVPKAPNRADVENRIAELERAVAELKKQQTAPPTDPSPPPVTLEPTPAPAPVVAAPEPAPAPAPRKDTPVYKKWWLWTIVGGVLVAGAAVTTAVVLTRPAPFNPDFPEFGPGAMSGLTIGF
jgi:tetratricopeptide (TPR) repeat protein